MSPLAAIVMAMYYVGSIGIPLAVVVGILTHLPTHEPGRD